MVWSTTASSSVERVSRSEMPGAKSWARKGSGVSAAASVNHLSCWRSIPRDVEIAPPARRCPSEPGQRAEPSQEAEQLEQGGLASGRNTTGLGTGARPGSSTSGPGDKALPATARTRKPIPDQTTGRQRGESSRPVGKYSGRKITKIVKMGA
jgi:hypothetical protein